MEIGLREWLIVIGIIVIAGILFDGWRRMRGGKGKLKFRLDRSFSNLPDDDENSSAEVLGPSRVLDKQQEPQLDEHDLPSMSATPRETKRNKRKDEPQQGDLNLDLDGPSLFTSRDDDFPDDKPPQRITEDKDLPPVEEVLVISVISRDESGFKGPALLQNILESGLRFGEMDIFHRHESMAGTAKCCSPWPTRSSQACLIWTTSTISAPAL